MSVARAKLLISVGKGEKPRLLVAGAHIDVCQKFSDFLAVTLVPNDKFSLRR